MTPCTLSLGGRCVGALNQEDDTKIEHNQAESRFQTNVDGGVAFTAYILEDGTLTFTHTEVPEAAEGQGVASKVVTAGLEYARDHKLRVVPVCSYVASFVKRHPEYSDLIAQP